MGFFRELLGAGTILSGYVGADKLGIKIPFLYENPISMMILPAGGFLMMGFLLATIQYFMNKKKGDK